MKQRHYNLKAKSRVLQLALSACIIFVSGNYVNAQNWLESVSKTKTNPSFAEKQAAFYDYYKGKDYTQFKGYKQFKRLEWFLETRIDSTGNFPTELYFSEINKVKNNKSSVKGGNWSLVGPHDIPTHITQGYRMGVGRIDNIIFHPTIENTYWVCAPTGGLWKTINDGETWEIITDNLPVIHASDLVINPENTDEMYLATGDRDAWEGYSIGVLKSTNGGLSWSPTALTFESSNLASINRLLMNPEDPQILIAATDVGIYKTTNGGDEWTLVTGNTHFMDMEFKPGDPSVIYASTYIVYFGASVYRSTDGGDSFHELSQTGIPTDQVCRIEVEVTPDNPEAVFALVCTPYTWGMEGLYKSGNSGDEWEQLISGDDQDLIGYSSTGGNQSGGQGFYNLALSVNPLDENDILVGGTHLWRSTNGGTSFTLNQNGYFPSSTWVHADFHCIKYNPLNNNVFIGCDGGVYKSDNGNNWTDISEGIAALQLYKMGVCQTNPDLVLAGAQDNGSLLFNADNSNLILFADGGEGFFDYTDHDVLYTSAILGTIYRSTNGGTSLQEITPGMSSGGGWMAPFEIDPVDHNTIYAGYTSLFKSTDRGDNWEEISNNFSSNPLECIEVAPSDPQTIYVATYFNIWKTTNGGTNWENIDSNLPSHVFPPVLFDHIKFYDMAVSSDDPNTVWVVFSNFSENNKVFKTTNGGESWENISGNLPNLPVNCITYQEGSPNGIYVGTDAGIFYTDDNMEEWIDYSEGLPNVIATELEIQYATNTLLVSTYGRGIWKTELYNHETYAPYARFAADKINVCGELPDVQFSEFSAYSPDTYTWEITPNTFTYLDGTDANSQNPKVHFDDPGIYTISLTVENENGSHTATKEDYIKINFEPVADFTYDIDDKEVTFYDESEYAVTYMWLFGDGSSSEEANPVHSYYMGGQYDVKQIVTNNCGTHQIEKSILIESSGIAEQANDNFVVYPNPASETINVAFLNVNSQSTTISIIDLNGKEFYSKVNIGTSPDLVEEIDVKSLPKGIYILTVQMDNETFTKKFEIQ